MNITLSIILYLSSDNMRLAWEARLSPKEAASFKTLYREAALTEKNRVQLFRLIKLLGCNDGSVLTNSGIL